LIRFGQGGREHTRQHTDGLGRGLRDQVTFGHNEVDRLSPVREGRVEHTQQLLVAFAIQRPRHARKVHDVVVGEQVVGECDVAAGHDLFEPAAI
jgi:hypothetical protein